MDDASPPLLPGDLVGADLVIDASVGRGGSARVYRARRTSTGEPFAVKVLVADPHAHARLDREHAALRAIDHPGVIRVLELGTLDDGSRYAVLPWCDGIPLSSALAHPGMTARAAVAQITAAAAVLAVPHAHGIVHRDLKPGHLWARPDGTIAIIDFGIARSRDDERITRTGTAVGTPGYMAPEQIIGAAVDPRADVFALGCILYEALTGSAAFAGGHVAILHGKILWTEPAPLLERCPEAPPALATLVSSMLAKHPGDRPADGAAVARALATLGSIPDGPRRRRADREAPTMPMTTARAVAVGVPRGRGAAPATAPAINLVDGSAIALGEADEMEALTAALGPDRAVALVIAKDLGSALARCTALATRAAAAGDPSPTLVDMSPSP